MSKKYLIFILVIIFTAILFLPVNDMSVQTSMDSGYPKQPLFLILLSRCGKGNIVCEPFTGIWEVFYRLYN